MALDGKPNVESLGRASPASYLTPGRQRRQWRVRGFMVQDGATAATATKPPRPQRDGREAATGRRVRAEHHGTVASVC